MIRNQWYAILEAKEIPKTKPIGVKRLGVKMVLWRTKHNSIGCISDRCCHRGAQFSIGKLKESIEDPIKHIECPFHGFLFDHTGRCVMIPANGRETPIPKNFRVNSYIVREAYGLIWIWWGEPQDNYPEIPFFEELRTFHYHTFQDHWPTHYSRAIENQLDVVHLPFVHRNTIGRGNRTLVQGPYTEWDSNKQKISAWFANERDHGQAPRKISEIVRPNAEPSLTFLFPNCWMLGASGSFRIVVIFAPIDEENTILYLRTYQRIITQVPLLRTLVTLLATPFNRIILNQDKRVVVTQEPKIVQSHNKEKLVSGDRPIIIYRRERERLQKLAESS